MNQRNEHTSEGKEMWALVETLWPYCRSITGDGVRKTLSVIGSEIPLTVHEVPSGTKAFDWEVPKEWNIRDAYVTDENGNKIIDFKQNNLHIVGYSVPLNKWMDLSELNGHLHSIESQPDAIPYVTSYYKEYWGFCLSHNQRRTLKEGKYFVCIDSSLEKGSLTYGECLIKGESEKEIFLSTYVCHPSMANNELSGPAVLTQLVKWISSVKRKFSYRIVFIPETIGSVVYLSRHHKEMKAKTIAGFNVSCVGDDHNYSIVRSRYGSTYADRLALKVLRSEYPGFKDFSFLDRGSDERQYCSPGIDLPLVCISRTKFQEYPEYHTSLDNLDYICEEGLNGALGLLKKMITLAEESRFPKIRIACEPQLGKRGLYPLLSEKDSVKKVKRMMNVIAYLDGTNDISDLCSLTGLEEKEVRDYIDILEKASLIDQVKAGSWLDQ